MIPSLQDEEDLDALTNGLGGADVTLPTVEDVARSLAARQMQGGEHDRGLIEEPDEVRQPAAPDRRPLRTPEQVAAEAAPVDPESPERPTLAGWMPEAPKKRGLPAGYGFMAGFSGDQAMQSQVAHELARPEREAALARQQDLENERRTLALRKDAREERMAGQKATKAEQEIAQLKAKNQVFSESIDPNSAVSKNAREYAAQNIETQAAAIEHRDKPYAEILRKNAANIRSNTALSAARLTELAKDKFVGNQVQAALSAAHSEAMEAIARGQLGLGYRRASETERHNRATEDNATIRIEDKNQGKQEKLNEKIESLGDMEDLAGRAQDVKKDVNTGWLAEKVGKARQFVGLADKKFDTLEALKGDLDSQIGLLRSGQAVSASEEKKLRKFLADLSVDDETFETKLDLLKGHLARLKERAVRQLQRHGNGRTIDRSNTARQATGETPALNPGEQAAKPAPHGQRVKQNGHVFEWNGQKYVMVQ